MFVILWEFEVKPGCETAFEFDYGPTGPWVLLFRQDSRYLETRLLRDPFRQQIYLTVDYWSSRESYLQFQETHRDEYRAIDAQCEALTLNESKLGEYSSAA